MTVESHPLPGETAVGAIPGPAHKSVIALSGPPKKYENCELDHTVHDVN
jgi:hypothetical protein